MRLDPPKLTERQQLSLRRRRLFAAAGVILIVTLMVSWLSLHAWSRDAFPAWLRAALDSPLAAIAALLPSGAAESRPVRTAHTRVAPVGGVARPLAGTPARALAEAVESAAAAQVSELGDFEATAERSPVVENPVARVQDGGPFTGPVEPTDPVPDVPVDAPPGDIVGDLAPEDFQLSLNPGLDVGAIGTGVGPKVAVEVGPDGTRTNVGVAVGTPVAPAGVDISVSLGSGNVGAAVGVETGGVATTSLALGTENGARVAFAGVAELGATVDPSRGTAVEIGSDLLGVEISSEGGNPASGSLLPNLQLGILGNR
jgi:hypothetical protein